MISAPVSVRRDLYYDSNTQLENNPHGRFVMSICIAGDVIAPTVLYVSNLFFFPKATEPNFEYSSLNVRYSNDCISLH